MIHKLSELNRVAVSLPQIDRMTVAEIKDMVRSATGITEFQRRVYLALLDVPKGSLITYGELALKVGCKSPRAVGNALHKNPFAPLVPCHRVVRANGEIGGYAFGEQEKLRLLREEARDCFGCGFRVIAAVQMYHPYHFEMYRL